MNFIKKAIYICFLLMAVQFLAMCSNATPNSDVTETNDNDNFFALEMDMTTHEISDASATITFNDTGKYFLSHSWSDKDEDVKLPSPEGLQFTVSAWNQDEEIYVEHFHPDSTYASATARVVLTINKSKINTPIDIGMVGTIHKLLFQSLLSSFT